MGEHKRRGTPPFLRDISGPIARRPVAKDRFGRELYSGDQVMIPSLDLKSLIWMIHKAEPNLHPGAPANLVTITVSAPFTFHVPADQATPEIILVRTGDEAGTVGMDEAPDRPNVGGPGGDTGQAGGPGGVGNGPDPLITEK